MTAAADLCTFVDHSPTPFHVCATAAARLTDAGYTQVFEEGPWPSGPGTWFAIRGGSLVAWNTEAASGADVRFRVVGGHTDSPNLRVKQHHDVDAGGVGVVALEPYGGAWIHSWLDRDLGIAGRLALRDGSLKLVHIDQPVLRVPQLAIHLSAEKKSIEVDPQRHLNAIWNTGSGRFMDWVADQSEVRADDVLGFELMTYDVTPSALIGANQEFVSAGRLDNQGTCFSGLEALLSAEPVDGVATVLALFDHEEIGSTSERGAGSDFLLTCSSAPSWPRVEAVRSCTARSPPRSVPRATWRTPPTPTTPTATSRCTRSPWAAALSSRSTSTCGTPPTPRAPRTSSAPATPPECPCSATSTAPTCRVDRPSAL